jgi:hypothetical protein
VNRYGEPWYIYHMGKLFLGVMVGVLCLVGWALMAEGKQRAAVCGRLMVMAETRRDSMDVIMRCQLPSGRSSSTTVVPIAIPRAH